MEPIYEITQDKDDFQAGNQTGNQTGDLSSQYDNVIPFPQDDTTEDLVTDLFGPHADYLEEQPERIAEPSKQKSRRLTKEVELAVAAQYKATGAQELADVLVESNMGVAKHYARSYSNSGEVAELENVGRNALYDALKTFEPELGNRFATFAQYKVRTAIERTSRRQSGAMHVGHQRQELLAQISKLESKHFAQHGTAPPEEYLMEELDLTRARLRGALDSRLATSTASLDSDLSIIGEAGSNLYGTLADKSFPSPETLLIQTQQSEHLRSTISRLPTKQMETLVGKYFWDCSMTEIAEAKGLSVEAIRLQHDKGIGNLNAILTARGGKYLDSLVDRLPKNHQMPLRQALSGEKPEKLTGGKAAAAARTLAGAYSSLRAIVNLIESPNQVKILEKLRERERLQISRVFLKGLSGEYKSSANSREILADAINCLRRNHKESLQAQKNQKMNRHTK
jgi:RNA polymerase sigma factor (sigma-70 family)